MGKNRKWVLENDLSEAVWRTIVRVLVPHRGVASCSTVQFFSSVDEGFRSALPWTGGIPSASRARIKRDGKSAVPQPLVVRLSPDERAAEARARVARLETAKQVLGAQPMKEALLKAREQSDGIPL